MLLVRATKLRKVRVSFMRKSVLKKIVFASMYIHTTLITGCECNLYRCMSCADHSFSIFHSLCKRN